MFLSNILTKNRRFNVSWETNASVFNVLLHWLPYERACRFISDGHKNIRQQSEGPASTPDIFVCNFSPFERTAAVKASKYRRLWVNLQANNGIYSTRSQIQNAVICRYEWTFHHGVIGFCGSPTQRRTSPALHTVTSTWKCGHDPHEVFFC